MEQTLPVPGSRPATRIPVAVTFVSTLNGASQPSIVMTTGASLYVAKLRNFTGKYGLISEVVGTELMAKMGLPVPKWNPILFTEEFLDHNQQVWRKRRTESRGIRPSAGLHFGSRVVGSEGRNHTFEIIPSSWMPRVKNREDFVGTMLIDLWTNNCDRRQCVFLTDDGGQTLRAVFIDNDHMFGGYFGDEQTCPRRVMGLNADLYNSVWNESAINRWKGVIQAMDGSALDSIFELVPEAWADRSELSLLRATLLSRRRRLDSLIAEVGQTLATCSTLQGKALDSPPVEKPL